MISFPGTIIETAILAEMLDTAIKHDVNSTLHEHTLFTSEDIKALVYKRYEMRLQVSEIYWGIDALYEDYIEGSCGLLRIPPVGEDPETRPNILEGRYIFITTTFNHFPIRLTPNMLPYKISKLVEHFEFVKELYDSPEEEDQNIRTKWQKLAEDSIRVWQSFTGIPYDGENTEVPSLLEEYYNRVDITRRRMYEMELAKRLKESE